MFPVVIAFLKIYGVTQDSETKEYMIVMQYANNGSLLSYLDQNINKLMWKAKLRHLHDIAYCLREIHDVGLVHCDLHSNSGNIVLDNTSQPFKAFYRLLHHRKSFIPANLLSNQMCILLVSLCT